MWCVCIAASFTNDKAIAIYRGEWTSAAQRREFLGGSSTLFFALKGSCDEQPFIHDEGRVRRTCWRLAERCLSGPIVKVAGLVVKLGEQSDFTKRNSPLSSHSAVLATPANFGMTLFMGRLLGMTLPQTADNGRQIQILILKQYQQMVHQIGSFVGQLLLVMHGCRQRGL